MAKITLPSINSGYMSTEALTEAFNAVEAAINNTISRDGSTPNQMEADLDMNGHAILNASAEGLVTQDAMEEYVDQRASGMLMMRSQSYTAAPAQTVFTITLFTYEPGADNLAVYVDGIRKFAPTDYVETDGDTITFAIGLTAGQKVELLSTEFVANISLAAHTHPWSDITGTPVYVQRWPEWTEVTGKPTTFTPTSHVHSAADITTGRLADARRGVYVQQFMPAGTILTGDLWLW